MPTDIQITVEQTDSRGRQLVVAKRGSRQYRDRFEINDAFRRRKFLDQVMHQLMEPSQDPDPFLQEVDAKLQEAASSLEGGGTYWKPLVINLSEVQSEPVRWLWPGHLARGKLTMLSGDPGLGKSLVTLDLAARVSRSGEWPDGSAAVIPASTVLLLSAEDDPADTLSPRLHAAGADMNRIHALIGVQQQDVRGQSQQETFSLTTMIPLLEETLQSLPECRLLVIDPITAYLQGVDSHRNAEVRSMLAPLSELAARYDLCVLAVTHLNKSGSGPAIYRSMGSLAFAAAARAVWAVVKQGERRLMLPVKNNLGQDQTGMAFSVVSSDSFDEYAPPLVQWEDQPVELTADEAMQQSQPVRTQSRLPSARDEASNWLAVELAAGPQPSKTLLERAVAMGHAVKTIRRAFRDLQGEAFQRDDGWHWKLEDV